jgi:protein TonB
MAIWSSAGKPRKSDGTCAFEYEKAVALLYEREGLSRSWGSALMSSSAIYIGLIVVAATLGEGAKRVVQRDPLAITFVETVAKPDPPPPPPQLVVEQRSAPAAAPVVPDGLQVRRLEKQPERKPLVAPKEMPVEQPKEADPSQDKGIAVFGEAGAGDPTGLEAGIEGGVVGGEVGVVWMPDDAVPPMPSKANSEPKYPRRARAAGQTGVVILKVAILADGSVRDIAVMGGEEPFASAAVDAVKKWTYEPARYKGQPISVYRTIRVNFELDR